MAMIRLILPLLFACSVAAQSRRAVREPKADTRVESALIDDVRKNPEDFQANRRLADYYRASQRMDAAIPFFEKAYQLNPGDYSNAWDLALLYLTAHKINEARKLVLGLQRQNDRAEIHNLLGSIEEAAGDVRAAVLEYQRAAQMEPSEKNVFDYATGFSKGKSYAEARQVFVYGVEKYPKSARMRVGLAVAYHGLGQYFEAVAALCQAVDLDPDDARPVYFLSSMHDVSPELSEHVASRLAHLVEVHPNNAQVNYAYAVSLWKRTETAADDATLIKVQKHLLRAVQLDPKLTDAHFQLGLLYEQRGELHNAIREFEEAVRLEPNAPLHHYRLGRAYSAARMPEKSEEQLRIFRQLKKGPAGSKPQK
jgi:tetratricopeptide (TPR) repeat protein